MFKVKLDKERELKFNLGSLTYLMKKFDTNLQDVFQIVAKTIEGSLEQLPTLVYAGIKDKSDITEEQVFNFVNNELSYSEIFELIKILNLALTQSINTDSKNVTSPKIPTTKSKKKTK